MSLNHDLSTMFHTMAAVLELRGEPVFKAIAFSKVARVLDDLGFDVRDAVKNDTLDDIEGIGKSSRKVIEDVVKTGRSVDFDELVVTVPAGLIEMLNLAGLGPKTVRLLWKEREITTIDELAAAVETGKLEGLKGVGAKKIEQIRQSLAMRATAGQRFGLPDAMAAAHLMLERVKAFAGVSQVEIAGSLRRQKETIGDVDLIVVLKDATKADALASHFVNSPGVAQVLGQGQSKASVRMESGLQIDLRVVPPLHFGATLLYFTGSKDHNIKIRGIAQDRGLTLNEWGIYRQETWDAFRDKHGSINSPEDVAALAKLKAVASKTEADIYEALGLTFIEWELRENRGEVELASGRALPKLITRDDIQGDLHCHTTASDGANSIEEMARAAKALGYTYLVITDHSKSQVIAHGLDETKLRKQIDRVRSLSDSIAGMTILVGSEVDILADGTLDYDDGLLADLDFVVASPHSALRQDPDKATARLLKAIDNRYVNVIGHPTGRLINQRAGLEPDWQRVFKAAADSGTALEINAGWPRLDLNDIQARAAVAAGVMLTIDTDAHSVEGLSDIDLGISVARRAGVEARHVLNTMPLKTVRSFVAKKR
jgi:DNA polymerase (family X)